MIYDAEMTSFHSGQVYMRSIHLKSVTLIMLCRCFVSHKLDTSAFIATNITRVSLLQCLQSTESRIARFANLHSALTGGHVFHFVSGRK